MNSADCPRAADSALDSSCVGGLCSDATVRCVFGLVGVVHTRCWAVERPRDDHSLGATTEPRRSLRLTKWRCTRCGGGCGALQAAAMACTRQTACTVYWGAKWPVMVQCAAYSALSKQQHRHFSATAERTERQSAPQARRKSSNDVNFCAFCADVTASAQIT